MTDRAQATWIAVDIGNTSMKFAVCPPAAVAGAPRSIAGTLRLETVTGDLNELEGFVPGTPCYWLIASVNRLGAKRLKDWLSERRTADTLRSFSNADVPLATDVDAPDRVGIDRLLAAYTVNQLRHSQRPAIIVGSGTAITADLLTADGVFRGGAIFPGLELMARALFDRTDALPLVNAAQGVPPLPGKNTTAAIQGAFYWGMRGALGAILERLQHQAGGNAEVFVSNLDTHYLSVPAREESFLVLRGLLAIAQESARG